MLYFLTAIREGTPYILALYDDMNEGTIPSMLYTLYATMPLYLSSVATVFWLFEASRGSSMTTSVMLVEPDSWLYKPFAERISSSFLTNISHFRNSASMPLILFEIFCLRCVTTTGLSSVPSSYTMLMPVHAVDMSSPKMNLPMINLF